VVDEEGRLVGKIRLRDLAFSTWDTPVRDIMEEADEFILASADQEEAARTLSKYDLVVLPVVDEFHHLLGVLTYDDALEILQEESTEDIEKLAAIGGEQSEVTYLNTSVGLQYRRRVTWLGRAGLRLDRLRICDVPFQRGLGKSLRARACSCRWWWRPAETPAAKPRPWSSARWRSAKSAPATRCASPGRRRAPDCFLGFRSALAIAAFITLMLPHFHRATGGNFDFLHLAAAVAAAITVQVFSATVIGALLPIGASAIHLDPAVVSAPSLASTVDVSGMLIYFPPPARSS
jgi:magnesium transporter